MSFESKGTPLGGMPRTSEVSQKGEKTSYRDPLFAVLWIVQLIVVLSSAVFLSPSTTHDAKKTDEESYIETALLALALLIVPLGAALVAVCLVFLFMSAFSQQVIQMAFFSPTIASIATSTIATYSMGTRALPLWYSTAGVAAVSAFMYFWVRRYVPFAASTLRVSLQALRDHKGLISMAMFTSTVVVAWFAVWAVASLGIAQYLQRHPRPPQVRQFPCEHDPRQQCSETVTNYEPFYLTVFLLTSLYWTSQVLSNVLHTTTVGTVASWWTSKTKNDRALREALYRSCTTSLGSICLGSLVVAIVSSMETILSTAINTRKKMEEKEDEAQRRARGQRPRHYQDGKNEIVRQLLLWIRKISEYINSWAFVYVGLYGYTYWAAGKKVSSALFSQTGRSTFASDRLVYRVFGLMKVAIALLSGVLLVAMQVALDWTASSNLDPSTWRGVVFSSGVVVGYWTSSVALSVLESIARTVIVCFIENPVVLQSSHPALYKELQHGWSTAYPAAWKSFKQKAV